VFYEPFLSANLATGKLRVLAYPYNAIGKRYPKSVLFGNAVWIGAHRDAVFGPVVAVGDGGKYVEIFRDTALLLPPFSKDDAREALGKLRIAPLFAGVRGEPPMDVDALSDAVVKIGELMLDPAAKVMSLDLNPVLLDDAGKGCVVVDAVVFRS